MATRPSTPWPAVSMSSGVQCELCERVVGVDEDERCIFCGWKTPLVGEKRASTTPKTERKANKRPKSNHRVAKSKDHQRSMRQSIFCDRLQSCDDGAKGSESDLPEVFNAEQVFDAEGCESDLPEVFNQEVWGYFDEYFENEYNLMSQPEGRREFLRLVEDTSVFSEDQTSLTFAEGCESDLPQDVLDFFS